MFNNNVLKFHDDFTNFKKIKDLQEKGQPRKFIMFLL